MGSVSASSAFDTELDELDELDELLESSESLVDRESVLLVVLDESDEEELDESLGLSPS